jgi:tetratricopeptide (TPR) repeat protein
MARKRISAAKIKVALKRPAPSIDIVHATGLPKHKLKLFDPANVLKSLDLVRNILTNLIFISLVSVFCWTIYKAIEFDEIIIEPISMPKPLIDRGYSAEVATMRLADAIQTINKKSITAKSHSEIQSSSREIDFAVPGSSVSLNSLIQLLRQTLGKPQTRVVGEFVCATNACSTDILLRLRILSKDMKEINLAPIGASTIDNYFELAGESILREVNPYVLASYYYEASRRVEALEIARRMIELDHPDKKWAQILVGASYRESKDFENATIWYQSALKTDPNFALAYVNLGNIQDDQNDQDGAIAEYEKAIAIDPNYAIVHSNLGNVLTEKNDFEGAIAEYQKAIAIDPDDAATFNGWGFTLVKKKDFDGAIIKYQKAIFLNPNFALAYYNWGASLYLNEDFDGAIAKYGKAIDLDPRYAWAYNGWGNALFKKNNYDAAIEKYNKAIEIDPKFAKAYDNLGRTLYEKKDLNGASTKCKKAIELKSSFAFDDNAWCSTVPQK